MSICITATEKDIDHKVDLRFGRCKYFIIIDPKTMKFEAVSNPALNESGGVGIKAATAILKYSPEAVITGLIGDNAIKVLQSSNTPVYSSKDVTVREAVKLYSEGKLEKLSTANN
jgi:predicted Fe-Mo cluster-binding NifX family protein